MPGGDRTGPMGAGPRTGRAMGICAGFPYPGFMNPSPGFGFSRGWRRGMGFGRGRGWRISMHPYWGYAPCYPYPPTAPYAVGDPSLAPEAELKHLKTLSNEMKQEMDAITKRIKELESKGNK